MREDPFGVLEGVLDGAWEAVRKELYRNGEIRFVPGSEASIEADEMKREASTELLHNPWWRRLASVAILVQLWAIVGRPLEFATQGPTGASPAATALYTPIKPYAEFTYLNHGYAFFAPNPGPSHLIGVTIRKDDGEIEESVYPSLQSQWPRLLYHRHFMLTEFLHNTFQPSEPPPEMFDVDWLRARWQVDRARYEAILESMRRHLAVSAGASTESVRIDRLEHQLLGLPEFLEDPRRLDDPELMVNLTVLEQQAQRDVKDLVPQMQWPTVERPSPSDGNGGLAQPQLGEDLGGRP